MPGCIINVTYSNISSEIGTHARVSWVFYFQTTEIIHFYLRRKERGSLTLDLCTMALRKNTQKLLGIAPQRDRILNSLLIQGLPMLSIICYIHTQTTLICISLKIQGAYFSTVIMGSSLYTVASFVSIVMYHKLFASQQK